MDDKTTALVASRECEPDERDEGGDKTNGSSANKLCRGLYAIPIQGLTSICILSMWPPPETVRAAAPKSFYASESHNVCCLISPTEHGLVCIQSRRFCWPCPWVPLDKIQFNSNLLFNYLIILS